MRTKNKYTANLAADKKEANGFNGVVDGGLLLEVSTITGEHTSSTAMSLPQLSVPVVFWGLIW